MRIAACPWRRHTCSYCARLETSHTVAPLEALATALARCSENVDGKREELRQLEGAL